MSRIEVKRICYQCNGTGEVLSYANGTPGAETPCTWPGCNGTGWVPFLQLSEDLEDLLIDMNNKIDDILEKVNE